MSSGNDSRASIGTGCRPSISAAAVKRLRVAGTSILLGPAACSGAQSALDVRGPAAQSIADIWWAMLAMGAAIYLIVVALVLHVVLRGRSGESDGSATRARRWILIGGIILPAVVLVPLFVASVRTLSSLMHDKRNDLTIHVTGRQWWWQIRYKGVGNTADILAANEIHVPVGRRVRIELATADVIHSLWIPNLHGKADLVPGRTNVMWIEASRAGISRGQCAEYCGTQHALMSLPVVADSQAAFDAWLARERLPAQVPVDSAASVGQSVFMSKGCWACHAIRGTAAAGMSGPDLTHLASRRTIAAGTLTNTPANLARWIANPQGIKPANKMPRVPLSSQQLSAIVGYLGTLR